MTAKSDQPTGLRESGTATNSPRPRAADKSRLDYAAIRRALLAWFRAYARVLPWRGTGDPYAVWVSEVMLQQTQIATVTPFYQRFLAAFPTVTDLAERRWSGCWNSGQALVITVVPGTCIRPRKSWRNSSTGSSLKDYAGLRTLPGIGDYTAKAVLSIAFNQPYAVLDGNVARVVARLCCLRGNLHQPQFRAIVETELAGLLSRREPGNFNQALMELGQTVCLPRGPRCSACPLAKWCGGFRPAIRKTFRFPALAVRRNPITSRWPFSAGERAWP